MIMTKKDYIQIAVEFSVLFLIIGLIFAVCSCHKTENGYPEVSMETQSGDFVAAGEDDLKPEEVLSDDKAGDSKEEEAVIVTVSGEDAQSSVLAEEKAKLIEADALKDDFDSTVQYLAQNAGKPILLDRSAPVRYAGRAEKYEPSEEYRGIEENLSEEYKLTRTSLADKETESPLTADVWRDAGQGIAKISLTEYGSGGRIITSWYFKERDIIYEEKQSDDLYGTLQHQKTVSLSEKEEASCMEQGYRIYDALKQVPGFARIYGYAKDEFGGLLPGVHARIYSNAHDYSMETETDGDGRYEFYVPVNQEDWYNISFSYTDWQEGSVNDIAIVPGVSEYSCGVIYMAPKGQNIHDADIYLMNVNQKSPIPLEEGEYAIVLSYSPAMALLRPCLLLQDGTTATGFVSKVPAGAEGKYYVTDGRNLNVNNMAYDMSACDARVTVYDKDGIAASFSAPAAHAGIAWEVFSLHEGQITPVNNYYMEAPADSCLSLGL